MAENLNYAYLEPTDHGFDSSSVCLNNNPANCAVYGRLYTWSAAIDSAALEEKFIQCGYGVTCENLPSKVVGVCPSGWHLPSKAEYELLVSNVGGLSTAGTKLKSTLWNGTDTYGWNALRANYGVANGKTFSYSNSDYTTFWTSTETDANYLNVFNLRGGAAGEFEVYEKRNARSVRCVMDK